MVIDIPKFSEELHEEFLSQHSKLRADDSALAQFTKISAEIAAMAIAKYDREQES